MENKKNEIPAINEVNDDQLDQVTGGAINVFFDVPVKREYWKYTCRVCGNVGVVLGYPPACCKCGDANIAREEYNPASPN